MTVSQRRRDNNKRQIFSEIVDILNLIDYRMAANIVKELLKEKEKLIKNNKRLEHELLSIQSEFNKKKIGKLRVIADKYKFKSHNQGVLYFNKQHIGKRAIVWEKPKVCN